MAAGHTAAVRMRGICKRFGSVQANSDVNLSVAIGSIHGIVGENGAGKSTLMSVLYGLYQADAGEIEVFGQSAQIDSADQAIALGLGMVHQHFLLVDTFSALDNVMLAAPGYWLLARSRLQVRERLEALMAATGLQIALDRLVAELSLGDRQRLEILKALYRGARVLILDEPTAVLTPAEISQLFTVLRKLRDSGTSILLITHKLKEVMALCDQVTVLRGGRVVQQWPISAASVVTLAQAMMGRKVNLARPTELDPALGATVLQASQISVSDPQGVQRLNGVCLDLRAGEIVGVAGVAGNGQSELLDVLCGLLAPQGGQLHLLGQQFQAGEWLNPVLARELGLAHVPEDRQARALVMDFTAWECMALGYDGLSEYASSGWMHHVAMRQASSDMMNKFDVRPADPELVSGKFSGGNQQKLVLARELGRLPKVLLVGQPTRGVDMGAIEFIYAQLRRLRDHGCAVLLVSSELDEILALADRVLVMHQGRIVGNLPLTDCSEAVLGLLMTGGSQ